MTEDENFPRHDDGRVDITLSHQRGLIRHFDLTAALVYERLNLQNRLDRALKSLQALQEGAAVAMPSFEGNETVSDFLAAIHREAVKGQLSSDEVKNDSEPKSVVEARAGA